MRATIFAKDGSLLLTLSHSLVWLLRKKNQNIMKFFRALLKLSADESLKELLACVLGDTSGEGVDGNLVKTELFSNTCPK